MNIKDFKSLKEIHQYFAVHNTCKLKNTATQPVYETTPPTSGIVFIGEAPGLSEDKLGKPFVGAAGKLLDELLQIIGFTREDVYVTNVVKYRPPNNRDPLDREKDACRVWVNAELLLIKPKVIVPLGRHSLQRFLPELNISTAHGEVHIHSSGTPILPMYHPAAALYNPNLKNTLQEDMVKLKEFLNRKPKKGTSKKKQSIINDILQL